MGKGKRKSVWLGCECVLAQIMILARWQAFPEGESRFVFEDFPARAFFESKRFLLKINNRKVSWDGKVRVGSLKGFWHIGEVLPTWFERVCAPFECFNLILIFFSKVGKSGKTFAKWKMCGKGEKKPKVLTNACVYVWEERIIKFRQSVELSLVFDFFFVSSKEIFTLENRVWGVGERFSVLSSLI